MNQILNRAAGLIEKRGLAIEAGSKDGAFCTAAALVESAYEHKAGRKDPVFNTNAYIEARNLFCGHIGINSSYQSIVEWNDDFKSDKMGLKIYKRTQDEVVQKLREAARKTDLTPGEAGAEAVRRFPKTLEKLADS